ncbi:tetratricopeptide repeat protein [Streptomyces chromofuscus]|uniref:tetratricopeptide repeat protein n=1 Tax=Streptomyces chromofuscus TaxID=42881 RepID=UPI002AD4DAF4|nr:tetratricopeptide repeat protein [Streptomyces chromofuscus]
MGTGAPQTLRAASANDATGRGEEAVPLSRTTLESGLTGERRRRAVVQRAGRPPSWSWR